MSTFEIEDIMKSLPHRYPFLLVDRIVECDGEKSIVGIKNVTMNEPFFQGHFPGMPVMPGVLQLEAMAQTAGVLLNQMGGAEGGVPFFMAIDKARFRRVVKPGDQLRIEVEIIKARSRSAKFKAVARVGDEVASEAEMMCMIGQESAQV
jgi:3-hydroxyacyl-[acyl-carrier-protein] dehydratase